MKLINVERLGHNSTVYAFDPNHHFFECGELERLKNNLNFATNGAAVIMSERTMFSRGIVVVFCNPTNSRYYTRDLVDDVVVSYLAARQEESDESDGYDGGSEDEDEGQDYGEGERHYEHEASDKNVRDYEDENIWDKYDNDEFDESYDADYDNEPGEDRLGDDSKDNSEEDPEDNPEEDREYDIIDEDYDTSPMDYEY